MIKNFLIKHFEIKKYIFAIFSVLWLCVIYSMSLQPADESAETSRDFGKLVSLFEIVGARLPERFFMMAIGLNRRNII